MRPFFCLKSKGSLAKAQSTAEVIYCTLHSKLYTLNSTLKKEASFFFNDTSLILNLKNLEFENLRIFRFSVSQFFRFYLFLLSFKNLLPEDKSCHDNEQDRYDYQSYDTCLERLWCIS